MKSVVMKTKGKYAAVLNDNGDILHVKNKNYQVGQRVDCDAGKKRSWVKWAVTAATAISLFFGGGAYAYYTPYSQMSIDVNPSIELSANIFNIVIDVKAMNEDAERLIQQLKLENQSVQQAVTALVDALEKEGYLTAAEAAGLMITTCSSDQTRAQDLLTQMIQTMQKEMDRLQVHADIQGERIGDELRVRAREYGVTPGKLILAERYMKTLANPTPEDLQKCFGQPVKELFKAIQMNEEQNREQNNEQNQEQNRTTPMPNATAGNGSMNQEQNQQQNGLTPSPTMTAGTGTPSSSPGGPKSSPDSPGQGQ